MKYLLAGLLVVAALVLVFHADRIIPIPDALGAWAIDHGGRHLPFSIKLAYASACLDRAVAERDNLRLRLSEAAVRTEDLYRDMARLDAARRQHVAAVQFLSTQDCPQQQADLVLQTAAFRSVQDRFAATGTLHTQHVAAVAALVQAEALVNRRIAQLEDRLRLIDLDHARHDALDLASGLASAGCGSPARPVEHAERTVTRLEFDERVREDLLARFGPITSDPWLATDPAEDAACILRDYGFLLVDSR